MADKTGIEWTDATWNPTTGCDKVSPGCDHCYAMTLAPRLKAMGSAHYQRDGNRITSGPGFGVSVHPDAFDKPLRWTRPRRIFVNSMSDLFHAEVHADEIAEVFKVMALAPQHTFQVLTKRHARMQSLVSGDLYDRMARALRDDPYFTDQIKWPLPNVWLGVSVEDQKWADIRIPTLARTPAAVRFLSCEPLLGPIDVSARPSFDAVDQVHWKMDWRGSLDWVIVGGESGPGARPMHLDWARSLRDQCRDAGVPFFYKQQGSGDGGKKSRRLLDGRTWDEYPA